MSASVLDRMKYVTDRFHESFFEQPEGELIYISSPGRMEILGNHTDHQHGYVLTSAVSLDQLGAARKNERDEIRLYTEGYSRNVVNIRDIRVDASIFGSSDALIQGVVHGFQERGYVVGGFDAFLISDVPKGSGLSSSASFEVWIATALNVLFCDNTVDEIEIAKICQRAENIFFGKPCGLQDQMACACGGILFIDFGDIENPAVEKFNVDLSGYTLCVIDSGANHANLTDQYSAITDELRRIAAYFDKRWLREVNKNEFLKTIPQLRKDYGDRAVLRAFHVFEENDRALKARSALFENDRDTFFNLLKTSGESSFMFLQNVSISGAIMDQPLAVVLALCNELLSGEGAFRIQGGGFAGTVEAFVPNEKLERFIKTVESIIGESRVQILSIRTDGAKQILKQVPLNLSSKASF
jgi:galactokinase